MMTCLLALTTIFAFAFVSCKSNDDDDKDGNGAGAKGTGLDYTSYPADYSIIVDNNSNKNLVLFKNQLKDSNMIGAVEKNESNHYIKNNKNLFASTSDFILIAITEDDYVSNKSNLSVLDNNPFARLYAFYNANAENTTVYKISGSMGGDAKIVLQNRTSYNVELRKNSKNGEVIGYASPQSFLTSFSINSGEDMFIFPVFIKYIPLKNAIFEFIPVYSEQAQNEKLRGFPKFEEIGLKPNQEYPIDAGDIMGNDVVLRTGSAYITILNESSAGVSFMEGANVKSTTLGVKTILKGNYEVFEISFPQNPDKSYPQTRTISSGVLKLGSKAAPLDIPAYTFKAETMYSLKITGPDAANLVLGEITETGAINWDNM
ncbi:hypothetical protein [uncultured Treponema sp.]|uniref:hypothetical protein n=1 Tax=uncultured Treponema sp. TaxID=162155 RepID=UPI0025CE0A67|nr:hypothetical protein [uncultured Treponema sp.]